MILGDAGEASFVREERVSVSGSPVKGNEILSNEEGSGKGRNRSSEKNGAKSENDFALIEDEEDPNFTRKQKGPKSQK